ncbi:MAG: hypothetical protein NC926_10115 [Candidatus Omnitrophica bacterium]|nr:hypothetical protein [Candidatus Omnitrophota bacterium]
MKEFKDLVEDLERVEKRMVEKLRKVPKVTLTPTFQVKVEKCIKRGGDYETKNLIFYSGV